jgi:serine/threonine protein kinase
VDVLKRGGPTKADVVILEAGAGPMVVKDFGGKAGWVRAAGRLQIARECAAYRWLGPMPGVPVLVGRVDAHALALEKVEGDQLADVRERPGVARPALARLRAHIDAIHAKGLAHLDLRGRENVLLRPDGEVVLVDFAGAVWLRPGGLLHRWLFPWMAWTDEAAYLKWKEMLTPGELTAEEGRFLRRFRRLRALWVFNPKRRRREGGGGP